MAADNSTMASTGRSGGGGASPDTYIGSLISLTSKSEIRYEGILYNINTEESSIGLRNVRSFGTEGRKLEAPQVPASDKIYEYILFRGSDIKDLQVKSSPPPQTTPLINSDPAIIQSHYPRPATPTTSLPTAPTGSLPDLSSHSAQMGLPASTFQGGLPLYQPGGNMNSWGPSPPNVNGTNLAVPMYWPGFYGTPGGVPQLPQQSLLRPPHGLSIHPSMQQMQYPGFNTSLPAAPNFPSSSLLDHHSQLAPYSASPSSVTSSSLPTSSFPLTVPSLQPVPLPSETMVNVLPNKSPVSTIPTSTPSSSLPSLAQPSASVHNVGRPYVANKPSVSPGLAALPGQTLSQPLSSVVGPLAGSVLAETPTPSLVTPGQLLQSGPPAVSAPQPLQTTQKDVEVVRVSSRPSLEPPTRVAAEAQPPLLPLPSSTRAHKPNGSYGHHGGAHHGGAHRYNYRGRGGRGSGNSHPVTKFTQEFDFIAMNEKFNKDEVWGHLGKSNKSKLSDSDEEDAQYEDEPKIEIKALYNKDDFFDSLSCNALDNDPNHGRTRYSEQMKLDTETFGDFSRYRGGGGRGGRGPGRGGGGRFRGCYYGRGYGYGGNRGRGRNN